MSEGCSSKCMRHLFSQHFNDISFSSNVKRAARLMEMCRDGGQSVGRPRWQPAAGAASESLFPLPPSLPPSPAPCGAPLCATMAKFGQKFHFPRRSDRRTDEERSVRWPCQIPFGDNEADHAVPRVLNLRASDREGEGDRNPFPSPSPRVSQPFIPSCP